jgi:hypothetical protein
MVDLARESWPLGGVEREQNSRHLIFDKRPLFLDDQNLGGIRTLLADKVRIERPRHPDRTKPDAEFSHRSSPRSNMARA